MRYLAILVLGLGFTAANADDSVRVVYSTVSDVPPESEVNAETYISRSLVLGHPPSDASSTDLYFEKVREILDRAHTPNIWGAPPIHRPFLTVTIVLGSRKHVLYTAYSQNRPELWLDPSAQDSEQFAALIEILNLTSKQSRLLTGGGT
jgi:hypothetical protein